MVAVVEDAGDDDEAAEEEKLDEEARDDEDLGEFGVVLEATACTL